jgi:hypothetical protein
MRWTHRLHLLVLALLEACIKVFKRVRVGQVFLVQHLQSRLSCSGLCDFHKAFTMTACIKHAHTVVRCSKRRDVARVLNSKRRERNLLWCEAISSMPAAAKETAPIINRTSPFRGSVILHFNLSASVALHLEPARLSFLQTRPFEAIHYCIRTCSSCLYKQDL